MSARPRFSIVTAVYGVEAYLPDFIASIEAQDFDLSRVQVVAVVDGSTDGSLALLEAWQSRRPGLVTVLTQENAGQGAARNRGMTVATGEWVTFTDPDDTLNPGYLSAVDTWLAKHPSAGMAATNLVLHFEDTGTYARKHPLKWHFDNPGRIVDLHERPRWFHGSAPSSFFRLDVLKEHGLQFDHRVRPNFEDGHFFIRYMLALDEQKIVFVSAAEYYYRKRAEGGSSLQVSQMDPRRYTDVMEFGYLDALTQAAARFGTPPEWVQNFVLYELGWYFWLSETGKAGAVLVDEDVRSRFDVLLRQIAARLDPEMIRTYSAYKFKAVWREILLALRADAERHTPFAVLGKVDEHKNLIQVSYRYAGSPPQEQFLLNGQPCPVVFGKHRCVTYFGDTVLTERIAWVSSKGRVRLHLDGEAVRLREEWPDVEEFEVDAIQRVRRTRTGDGDELNGVRKVGRRVKLARRMARSRPARRYFRNTWVLMDRVHDAGDSAETLFRYLTIEVEGGARRSNAWFVIEKGTSDWKRLRRLYGRRVVAHGSWRWKLLIANAKFVISSHIDRPIIDPPAAKGLLNPSCRFVFLQHGVIKDDLSAWLNPKPISLFVTSTVPEYQSITGDGTNYVFTKKEVALTGLPRFDELYVKGQLVPPDQRDLVLVAPTWRSWLLPPLQAGSQRREVTDETLDSPFMQAWLAFLRSPELADATRASGLKVGFLPHPNLQPALSRLDLPESVIPLSYDDTDVQMLFARAAVLVTDYSSVAFNAAFMNRPVVYYQFDQERVFGGGHVGSAGYFSYERDGFGPVATDLEQAIKGVCEAISSGPEPAPVYASRIEQTFQYRDASASARVAAAIRAIDK